MTDIMCLKPDVLHLNYNSERMFRQQTVWDGRVIERTLGGHSMEKEQKETGLGQPQHGRFSWWGASLDLHRTVLQRERGAMGPEREGGKGEGGRNREQTSPGKKAPVCARRIWGIGRIKKDKKMEGVAVVRVWRRKRGLEQIVGGRRVRRGAEWFSEGRDKVEQGEVLWVKASKVERERATL